MATTGSYFLDTIDFSSATAVFTDINLTTKALDGHYSFNGSVRQQVSGLLNAIMVCPTGMTLTNYFTLNYDTSCLSACTAPVLVPVVNCVVSDWSACVNGTQTRSVTTQASGGGTECPALSQPCTVPCTNCVPGTEIQIGSQIWTKCNLDVTTYSDLTPIPQANNAADWQNAQFIPRGVWCYYEFNSANGPIYGKLYNIYAILGIHNAASYTTPSLRKKLAPTGYHVPTDGEWTTLTATLGGGTWIDSYGCNCYDGYTQPLIGDKLKDASSCYWGPGFDSPNNISNFTALPGGTVATAGYFNGLNYDATFGTTSKSPNGHYYQYTLSNFSGNIGRDWVSEGVGVSVRLIKD